MSMEYVGFHASEPSIKGLTAEGGWLEFPHLGDDVIPLMERHASSIEKVFLIRTKYYSVEKQKLIKIVDRMTINQDLVTLDEPDLGNRRLKKFLRRYSGWENELNLLFQSSDLKLLKEIFYLFPKPYREKTNFDEDHLCTKGSSALEEVKKIVSTLDDNAYLISSAMEDCLFCILGKKPIIDEVRGWQ